jgi:hypothetical protein
MIDTARSLERDDDAVRTYVGIIDPHFIYIGVSKRADFDKIALPMTDHGAERGAHCLSKTLKADGVMVIFQYWLVLPQ